MTRETAQRHKINRVINFVHANLHEDIDLHRLADVACLSKYHFVRVFDDHLQQTPLRFLNRMRLERAARQLIYTPSVSIGSIATRCGFSAHQSFTRAFSRHFECAPHDFRLIGVGTDVNMPIAKFEGFGDDAGIQIEKRAATRVAYIRHFGPYRRDTGGIRQASLRMRDWAETRGLPERTSMIGLCPDNRRITPTQFCIYDVGVAVPDGIDEDDVVSIMTIPAGYYATTTLCCRNEQIISAWDWLLITWRESSAASYEQRWSYEVFHNLHDGILNPKRGMQLCLRLSNS